MNGLSDSVVSPARSIEHLAAARPHDEERILAEERVARHLLAAFDRLEQERVVGVLRHLEERRDRRQQVGDDLLVDRHERAALRQLLEFVERRDLHRYPNDSSRTVVHRPSQRRVAPRPASLRAPGRCPVHHSNCRSACAMSIGRPSSTSHPARRASATSARVARRRRSGRRRRARRTARRHAATRSRRPAPPSGVQFTSRSQVPGAGGHAPRQRAERLRPLRLPAPCVARTRSPARRATRGPRRPHAPSRPPRAPSRAPRPAACRTRSSSGARKPSTSVLVASHAPSRAAAACWPRRPRPRSARRHRAPRAARRA